MSRQGKLFFITIFYPLITAIELKFGRQLLGNLGDTLWFDLNPCIFTTLFVTEICTGKFNKHEKKQRNYFLYSLVTFAFYYCLCAIINVSGNEYIWIIEHNDIIFYFVILSTIFYLYSYREHT